MIPQTNQVKRFIAIDARKHYLVIGGLTTPQFVRKGLMKLEMGGLNSHPARGHEETYRCTRGGARSDRRRPTAKTPAAVFAAAAGGINLTCQHIGGRASQALSSSPVKKRLTAAAYFTGSDMATVCPPPAITRI
jgi:hypothetical protein